MENSYSNEALNRIKELVRAHPSLAINYNAPFRRTGVEMSVRSEGMANTI